MTSTWLRDELRVSTNYQMCRRFEKSSVASDVIRRRGVTSRNPPVRVLTCAILREKKPAGVKHQIVKLFIATSDNLDRRRRKEDSGELAASPQPA
jgi:hypothetical protein